MGKTIRKIDIEPKAPASTGIGTAERSVSCAFNDDLGANSRAASAGATRSAVRH
jgi:hypothetical protein